MKAPSELSSVSRGSLTAQEQANASPAKTSVAASRAEEERDACHARSTGARGERFQPRAG